MPQHFETGEPRQHGAALGAEFGEGRARCRLGTDLERGKSRPQRPPLQRGDGGVVDHIALTQPRQNVLVAGQHIG